MLTFPVLVRQINGKSTKTVRDRGISTSFNQDSNGVDVSVTRSPMQRSKATVFPEIVTCPYIEKVPHDFNVTPAASPE